MIARVDGQALRELFSGIRLPERALITLLDPQRRIIYRSHSPEVFLGSGVSGTALLTALGSGRTAVTVVKSPLDEVERVYGVARVGATDYIMTVGVPSATLYDPARRQLARLAGFGLLALVCAVTAALHISRGIARPLDHLSLAAHAFGEGDMAARAQIEGPPRLARLGATFNAMAEHIQEREKRLNELDRLKSEFVSSASHELRTPLTTIKALTRLLLRIAFRPTPDGAKTSLYASTVPNLPGGSYVVPDGPFQLRGEPTLRSRERAIQDSATARQLWVLSEQLTSVHYSLPAEPPCV